MKTGFDNLDKMLDLGKLGVILLTGINFIDILSGDIANNICLNQEYEVLEVVSHKKEYLIKFSSCCSFCSIRFIINAFNCSSVINLHFHSLDGYYIIKIKITLYFRIK